MPRSDMDDTMMSDIVKRQCWLGGVLCGRTWLPKTPTLPRRRNRWLPAMTSPAERTSKRFSLVCLASLSVPYTCVRTHRNGRFLSANTNPRQRLLSALKRPDFRVHIRVSGGQFTVHKDEDPRATSDFRPGGDYRCIRRDLSTWGSAESAREGLKRNAFVVAFSLLLQVMYEYHTSCHYPEQPP